MDIRDIEYYIRLVEKSKIAELEIVDGKQGIRIRKNADQPAMIINSDEPVAQEPVIETIQICSAMVGTFCWKGKEPEAKPVIWVGKTVQAGETVGYIEAMQIYKEVASDYPGTVIEILVKNNQPVEYGQPLMIIELAPEQPPPQK
ncbi:MAG: biotin/lipoyl-containing protein [Patescibacteria group bacterium]